MTDDQTGGGDRGRVRGRRAPWQRKAEAQRVGRTQRLGGSSTSNASKLFAAFRTEETSRTPRAKLLDMFGRRRGKLDTKAAADELGVSQRTVQRWVKTRKVPNSPAGQRLLAEHERWRTQSPAGRRKALNAAARTRAAGVNSFRFTGWVKISSDLRFRKGMQVEIQNRDAMDRMLGCLASGDDAGAHRALEDVVSSSPGWGGDVSVDLDKLDIDWPDK